MVAETIGLPGRHPKGIHAALRIRDSATMFTSPEIRSPILNVRSSCQKSGCEIGVRARFGALRWNGFPAPVSPRSASTCCGCLSPASVRERFSGADRSGMVASGPRCFSWLSSTVYPRSSCSTLRRFLWACSVSSRPSSRSWRRCSWVSCSLPAPACSPLCSREPLAHSAVGHFGPGCRMRLACPCWQGPPACVPTGGRSGLWACCQTASPSTAPLCPANCPT